VSSPRRVSPSSPARVGASSAGGASAGASSVGGPVGTFTVVNAHGLHARRPQRWPPWSASSSRTLRPGWELRNLTTGSAWVPAVSLSKLGTLGALAGHQVEVRAEGVRAEGALDRCWRWALGASTNWPLRPIPGATGWRGSRHPAGRGTDRPGGGARPVGAPIGAAPGLGIGPARPLRTVPGAATEPHRTPARLGTRRSSGAG